MYMIDSKPKDSESMQFKLKMGASSGHEKILLDDDQFKFFTNFQAGNAHPCEACLDAVTF